MKSKICPKCHSYIPWDGFGWTCEKCGYTIEPTPEEVREAVLEQTPPSCQNLSCLRLDKEKREKFDLIYQIMLILQRADRQRSSQDGTHK